MRSFAAARIPLVAVAIIAAACSGGGGSGTPTSSAAVPTAAASTSAAAVTASASPSASVASPSVSASATAPSASASASAAAAACMPKATRDLLLGNLTKLGSLTPAQRTEIVAALKAYAFTDAAGTRWRDSMVDAISAGDYGTAGLGAMSIASGQVTIKACP